MEREILRMRDSVEDYKWVGEDRFKRERESEKGWVFRAGGGLTKRGARKPLSSVTLIFIF